MMLAAVLGLTGYAALVGNDSDSRVQHSGVASTSSPAAPPTTTAPQLTPTYSAPPTWTEPERWLAAPKGSRKAASGRETGFPATADGAIGMMVAASAISVEGSDTLANQQLVVYSTYMLPADQSPMAEAKVRQGAERADAGIRRALGLPSTGPLPSGAFMRTTMIGFRPIQVTPTQVAAYVLVYVTNKGGEMVPEQTVYTMGILAAVWQDGDWKLSGQATKSAIAQADQKPPIAAPGDAAFNAAGWTAIRQAS
ncbi:hypothetical protein [Kitasatospora sp. SUK 42]|uniref:hypothetical protein n=1 Tax=Kitasatospora sp. SUK 42 TaxID=1588882 RepID=UPI0018C9561B|nr:hypothetical protein [Kitasatospora sp. SUK 42]MBV2155074.1 hypothetical protein [Kitasatospora sp. SUK 42]